MWLQLQYHHARYCRSKPIEECQAAISRYGITEERFCPVIRKLILSVLLAVFTQLSFTTSVSAQSISYACTLSAGVPLKVITVDLNDPLVKVTGFLTKNGVGHGEPFNQLVRRANPSIAITGTFFCNRSLKPIGDIVINGQLACFGGLGTALCVNDQNQVEFITPEHSKHQDWSAYDYVLCSGPRLIRDGTACVYPKPEGFRDAHMLNMNGRAAVGLTRGNKLLFVATRKPVYLSRLAKAMRALRVVDAINLDGGSSVGVYYKGKVLISPSRWLTNLMVAYQDRGKYDEVKARLLPERMRAVVRINRQTSSTADMRR